MNDDFILYFSRGQLIAVRQGDSLEEWRSDARRRFRTVGRYWTYALRLASLVTINHLSTVSIQLWLLSFDHWRRRMENGSTNFRMTISIRVQILGL